MDFLEFLRTNDLQQRLEQQKKKCGEQAEMLAKDAKRMTMKFQKPNLGNQSPGLEIGKVDN